MKYVNQLDYPHLLYVTKTDMEGRARERGKTSTVKTSGCGLCSAVMVADRLLPNCEFSLEDALDLSYAVKANHKRGTDYNRFAPAFAEKMGLKWEASKDLEDLRRCLNTVSCTTQGPAACSRATCCHTLPRWEKLDKMVDEFFEGITLADLLKEQ